MIECEGKPRNLMEPIHWIPPSTAALLDVGCNTGDLLYECRVRYPQMHLAGIDINHSAIWTARTKVPDAEFHQGYGYQLPFPDNWFQCVTCVETIEHVPEQYRALMISEMRRVLAAGGRLVLRCPHAGLFDWLDAQNFRFPRIYKALVGEGNRDACYREVKEELVWHHHFTREELIALAGNGWQVEACRLGGLVLFPMSDILRWPFYRLKRPNNFLVRTLARIATVELGINFGKASYDILLVLKKVQVP